jgi:hypothetical protein
MSHPFIDIAAITADRNIDTILQFLHDFNDKEEVLKMEVTEVMVYKNIGTDETERMPVNNLIDAFELGVKNPNICFVLLLGSNKGSIEWTTVTFTFDNNLVLGLSIREFQDDNGTLDNWQVAEELKNMLLTKYNSKTAVIGLEADFPLSEPHMYKLKELWKN